MESSGRGTERHSAVVWGHLHADCILVAAFRVLALLPKERFAPEVSMATIIRGALPFMGLQLLGVTLCIVFPGIVLWLPKLLYAASG
jgi:TRAP-type mannitol/chloroaromatic compound transport system permease large subunit